MSAPVLPWIVPAIREILIESSAFTVLVGGRVSSSLPRDLPGPCVKLTATVLPIDVAAGAYSPLVQVDTYVPPGTVTGDPEEVAWKCAATAASVLSTVRNRSFDNIHFTVRRITDGPLLDVDETRGPGNPLHRGIIRAELIVHAR